MGKEYIASPRLNELLNKYYNRTLDIKDKPELEGLMGEVYNEAVKQNNLQMAGAIMFLKASISAYSGTV